MSSAQLADRSASPLHSRATCVSRTGLAIANQAFAEAVKRRSSGCRRTRLPWKASTSSSESAKRSTKPAPDLENHWVAATNAVNSATLLVVALKHPQKRHISDGSTPHRPRRHTPPPP
eukprot:402373-Prorocentrum_minimum.AAC.1